MTTKVLSLVTIIALSDQAYAGGNIVPVEPLPIVIDHNALYLGLGFGQIYVNDVNTDEEISNTTMILQAGYQYNEYIAIESRYTFGLNADYDPGNTANLSSDYDGDMSSWGIYIKPIYPIGDFSVYTLLGYGGVMMNKLVEGDAYEDGFQWGLGANYAFSEDISVFIDYISLYNDTGFDYRAQFDNIDSYIWTLGVSYKF